MLQRLLLCLVLLAAAPVRADDFIDQANAAYRSIQAAKRSDVILLPLIAKMDAAPAAVDNRDKAMLIPAGSSAWSAIEAWANGANQRAVLDKLHAITQEENPIQAYAFGQPYGADALAATSDGIAMVQAGLYTELGAPPLLAAAKFQHLPALDRIGALVHVEATRLASTGKIAAAIDLLIDWLFFARQMADRQMFEECRWGIRTMGETLDRIRDIAYTDFRYGLRKLTPEEITPILNRLRPEGFIGIERISFPRGNEIAGRQVIATIFEGRNPNLQTFASTMSRLASTQRPLRLFAEAARWNEVATGHANAPDTTAELQNVYGDWISRWPLEPFDPRLGQVTDYEKMSRRRFMVIGTILQDMGILLNDRQILRTQLVGTRDALGVVAYYYRSKNFPPKLESIRPTFVKTIEADPFNPDRARGKNPPLEYFVPIRDQTFAPGTDPQPHTMNVLPRGGQMNFQVKIDQDQFVLYSVGPDGAKGWAKEVSGGPAKGAVGDLLIWPPATSLIRQRLQETKQIQ